MWIVIGYRDGRPAVDDHGSNFHGRSFRPRETA
jgi:hypothetical protein